MNLIYSRTFSTLVNRINIKPILHEDRKKILCHDINLEIFGSQKVMKLSLYEKKHKYKSYNFKQKRSLRWYEYVLLGIPIITFGLGTWQVKRRTWKLNLIKELNKRISSEPVDLPLNLDELKSMEYIPVKMRGQFLYENEFIIGPRSLLVNDNETTKYSGGLISAQANAGYLVITPFKLENQDLTILVNRGWIPTKLKDSPLRMSSRNHDTVEIVGIVRNQENRPPLVPKNNPQGGVWYYRDVKAMAEMTGASPVYIDLHSKECIPNAPISCQTRVNLRNEHLTYIITWYSLSGFTAYLWYKMILRK